MMWWKLKESLEEKRVVTDSHAPESDIVWEQKKLPRRPSLEFQWLILWAPDAQGMGLIPSWGIKIPHATQPKKKKKIA